VFAQFSSSICHTFCAAFEIYVNWLKKKRVTESDKMIKGLEPKDSSAPK
jgi:hypothetical protein